MARPSQAEEQRTRLLPILVDAFVELGYRRCTTAELARRCEVRENILYRLWPDKKAMFIAAIEHVFTVSAQAWSRVRTGDGGSAAERILAHEARHHGEFGNFRIVFAGLSEADDPEIRRALRHMYQHFHAIIEAEVATHRNAAGREPGDAALAAWALIGIATTANIGRQLRFLSQDQRRALFEGIGRRLLD
ncbi:MAG: TetR/AcrR family transcriptional regulator [Planctomycetes bacterium]|nr:TetR/AcrR family transcriptional regulator [Planctomycetota bacterium]MCB9888345.1 TetR/AcrR family transcriptional regulator [Planctomycetota bacterium]